MTLNNFHQIRQNTKVSVSIRESKNGIKHGLRKSSLSRAGIRTVCARCMHGAPWTMVTCKFPQKCARRMHGGGVPRSDMGPRLTRHPPAFTTNLSIILFKAQRSHTARIFPVLHVTQIPCLDKAVPPPPPNGDKWMCREGQANSDYSETRAHIQPEGSMAMERGRRHRAARVSRNT